MSRYPHLAAVDGWLSYPDAEAVGRLLDAQREAGVSGDVAEIGVYAGRLFIVLALGLAANERAVAVDPFGGGQNADPRQVHGDSTEFLASALRWAPVASLSILIQRSEDLSPEQLETHLIGRCRFVSVDGDHREPAVTHDLLLAEASLVLGGIVALDDWNTHNQWPGVRAGYQAYRALAPRAPLIEVGRLDNKLILTNDPRLADRYRGCLLPALEGAML